MALTTYWITLPFVATCTFLQGKVKCSLLTFQFTELFNALKYFRNTPKILVISHRGSNKIEKKSLKIDIVNKGLPVDNPHHMFL